MQTLDRIQDLVFTPLGDIVFAALGWLGASLALLVIAQLLGVGMLYAWRYTSYQSGIAAARRTMWASLLGSWLFRENQLAAFRAQANMLWQSLKVLAFAVPPLIVLAIPFLIITVQIGLRYEYRPPAAGEPVRVIATLATDTEPHSITLSTPGEVELLSGYPTYDAERRALTWAVRADAAGKYTLDFGDEAMLPLIIGQGLPRLDRQRGGSLIDNLLFTTAAPLSAGSSLSEIRIAYPKRETALLGLEHLEIGLPGWLLGLLVLSIVFALLYKPLVNVHL